MFGFLKEKLKSWIGKAKEEFIEVKEKPAKKAKKTSKSEKSQEKKSKPKKKINDKKIKQTINTISEEIKETAEELNKEKESAGFWSGMFSHKITEEEFETKFQELELILMQSNVAYEAIQKIKENLKTQIIGYSSKIDMQKILKESINALLINPPNFIEEIKKSIKQKKPYVILFAGINGSGKTTTIAKIANLLQKNKLRVCLASADTFRAAAIEQLQQHADKLKIPLIKKEYGADPASVGFDAITYAKKHLIDCVLIDTAGRMNNRDSLMREIQKIARVNKPDLKIFIGESITGNDATEQAKTFNDILDIDGIILAKADVDEKGGTAISVSHITKKPIYFLGTGQRYEDLEVFSKEKIMKKIFE